MKIKVQVVIEYEDETTETVVKEIGCLQRAAPSIETLGIRLDEGKAILANLQESVVAHQVAEHMKKHEYCATVTNRIDGMAIKPSPIAPCLGS
ncbi:MAG: hypothetical protein IPH82_29535 [Chloroflexi bacterium]|nr:hypothetical protein [Chloroflexota bacterium]